MRRWWSNRTSPLSIALPIIIALIVLVIIIKAVSSFGSTKTTGTGSTTSTSSNSVNILPKKDAKVSIYMSSDSQNEITGPTKLFPTDKMVRVTSGDSDVEIEGSTTQISIESLSELAYLGKIDNVQGFSLQNGYIWIASPNGDTRLQLKYFSIQLSPGAIVIANQNTRASNVYVLAGDVEVKSEAGSAKVGADQMLSLLQSESKNTTLGDKISPLDDFIKQSSMFIKKDGANTIAQVNASGTGVITGTGGTSSGTSTPSDQAISLTYPEDEMTVDTGAITLEWKILNTGVAKISFGKRDAQILTEDRSFRLKDYILPDATNDISYRVFDVTGNLMQKGLVTVNVSTKKPTIKKPDVINFPISSKDFKIISPTENPYKTTENSVKLKGSFAPDLVKYIKINSYQLQQFKQFGTTWTYNASIENGNMEEGVNEYLVTYYGPNDEVLITSKVYIVKEKPPIIETNPLPSGTASGWAAPSL